MAIFRLVPGCVKLFPADGTMLNLVGDVFTVEQRLKPGIER